MNILFIAPYRQSDGWGFAARDYARALARTEFNVAIRPIYMGPSSDGEVDEELAEMEGRRLDRYDLIIQKVLPHLFEKRDIPSMGLFTLETGNLKRSPWYDHIKLMDGALVPSSHEKTIITLAGGVNGNLPRCWNISEPIDTSLFHEDYGWLEGAPKDSFNFYFIGEFIPRKNLDALIKAFHIEFHRSEPVNLVIKTNRSGFDSHSLNKMVSEHINDIKRRMRIYENPSLYKPELLVTQRLSDVEMCELHKSCDCFVMPSYGEALCRPAVDAMGFGNPCIVTNKTGMTDFIKNDETGWVVPSHTVPVDSSSTPLPTLYTGRETWSEIDICLLQKAMREAYEQDKEERKKMSENCKLTALTDFSYDNIADNIEVAVNEFFASK